MCTSFLQSKLDIPVYKEGRAQEEFPQGSQVPKYEVLKVSILGIRNSGAGAIYYIGIFGPLGIAAASSFRIDYKRGHI